MPTYNVYYLRSPNTDLSVSQNSAIRDLRSVGSVGLTEQFRKNDRAPVNFAPLHTFVKQIEARDLEQVFYQMQAEQWSPNGQAHNTVVNLGLDHTSMSVGDMVEDLDNHRMYMVDPVGFREIITTMHVVVE